MNINKTASVIRSSEVSQLKKKYDHMKIFSKVRKLINRVFSEFYKNFRENLN